MVLDGSYADRRLTCINRHALEIDELRTLVLAARSKCFVVILEMACREPELGRKDCIAIAC